MSLCGIPEAELLLEEGGVLWGSLLELEGDVLCELLEDDGLALLEGGVACELLEDDGLALDGLVL